jgi:FkbM family methyltransferase
MGDFRNYLVDGIKLYRSDFNIEWIYKYLNKSPSVIIEFGSYDAGDGVYYKKSFPASRVISIEACKERFSTISEYNKHFGIELYNYAVCDYDGEIKFYQVKDPNVMDNKSKYGSSGSINKRTQLYKNTWTHIIEQEPIITPCIRLDTFCKNIGVDNIDFLHVDVEGAEHKVVEGFGTLRPLMLWMETHLGQKYYGEDAYNITELNEILQNMGYERIVINGADTLYVLRK